jgi:hypothetical protein
VDIDRSRSDIAMDIPGQLHELPARQRSTGVCRERGQQLVLAWTQMNRATVMPQLARHQVEVEAGRDREAALRGGCSRGPVADSRVIDHRSRLDPIG